MEERELTPELAKQLFGPRDLDAEQPEPPVEGLPPGGKPISEYTEAYTEAEREAQSEHTLQVLRHRERDQEEERKRREDEANRTDA